MAASQENRFNLFHSWDLGENGWNTGMDANLLRLGHVGIHLSVLDRDLTTPPGSPAVGDTYIPASPATDAWVGLEDDVVVWDGSAWLNYTPRTGWVAFIEDEVKLSAFYSAAWSAGIAI